MIITGIDISKGFKITGQLRPAALPTIGTATVISNTSANVAFTAPADQGDSAIIGYTAIVYPGGARTEVLDANANNITITGLTPGTRYTLSVTANNSEAPSGNSQSSNLITTLDVPGPPISQLYRLSHTSANVYYTLSANTGNSSPIALIVQSNTGTILVKNHSISEVSSGNISITGLASNTSHTIQLYANNISGIGSITSLPPFFTSLVPDSPTISYVDITSPITANIVFAAPEYVGTGIISYTGNANNIFYSTLVQSGSGNINVTGLSQNTTYSFNVVATSSQGNSSPSSAIASTWGARVIPSPSSINEGGIVTFSAITTNIPTGTTLYWTVNNITTSNVDFTSNIVTGSFIVTANAGSFTVTANSDLFTDGVNETFTVSVRSSNVIGTVMATSSIVTINDTSFTQTYAATPAASSIDEGSALTINVATTYVEDGVPLYWTINNTTTSNVDFTSATVSGTFTITANVGSFTITPVADITTEGAETFTVSIRTGSIVGPVVATTSAITINDISLTRPTAVDYLVVAGGGGGGMGGGGGAGGYRIGLSLPISPGSPYTVTVGGGGQGATNPATYGFNPPFAAGKMGQVSIFSTVTAAGGGPGAFEGVTAGAPEGFYGGSGGGNGWRSPGAAGVLNSGGTGNTPAVSPPQGNNGGGGRNAPINGAGGGGGGAGGVGTGAGPGNTPTGGAGGIGRQNDFASSGTLVYYAGGGGGGGFGQSPGGNGGAGGGGGGGSGGVSGATQGAGGGEGARAGFGPSSQPGGGGGGVNTGGGGGGGYQTGDGSTPFGGGVQPSFTGRGGPGGPGIVIVRHPDAFSTATITGTGSVAPSGGNVVYIFTGPGTIIW
jgi:hypothetical protein